MSVEQFESGAVRDSQEGKIKYELITPTFKKDLAAMLTDKAKHYGDRNWERGIPTARTFSSLLRHVEALGRGEWLDEESGHPHTVLAAANLMFIHEFHGTEFDTLHELVGPALRGKVRSVGSVEVEILERGEPEPPHDTVWLDTDGDTWRWHPVSGGWYFDQSRNTWEEVQKEFGDYFPWVRVS